MFRRIYRAWVISRTKSTAMQIATQLTARDLKDIGVSRGEIVSRSLETVRKEFAQADIERANKAIRVPERPGLHTLYRFFHLRNPA